MFYVLYTVCMFYVQKQCAFNGNKIGMCALVIHDSFCSMFCNPCKGHRKIWQNLTVIEKTKLAVPSISWSLSNHSKWLYSQSRDSFVYSHCNCMYELQFVGTRCGTETTSLLLRCWLMARGGFETEFNNHANWTCLCLEFTMTLCT